MSGNKEYVSENAGFPRRAFFTLARFHEFFCEIRRISQSAVRLVPENPIRTIWGAIAECIPAAVQAGKGAEGCRAAFLFGSGWFSPTSTKALRQSSRWRRGRRVAKGIVALRIEIGKELKQFCTQAKKTAPGLEAL